MPNDSMEFHEEAAAEYDAAFDWYLEQSPDAALKFDAEVDRALTHIVHAPRRWKAGQYSTRRFLLRQLPFIVIYRQLTPGDIQIVAIAHSKAWTLEGPSAAWRFSAGTAEKGAGNAGRSARRARRSSPGKPG
jgi:plasmid stabilization system protein ParE